MSAPVKIRKKYNFVYKTTNLVNGKIYIGQHKTNNLEDGYIGSGVSFSRAVAKYGKENFKFEIIESCLPCRHHLNSREIHWIAFYNSTKKEIGYNIGHGGEGFGCGELNLMFGKTGSQNPFFGKKHPKHIQDIIAHKNRNRRKVTCNYCGVTMDCGSAKAYHFENCLSNPNIRAEGLELHNKRKAHLENVNKNKKIHTCPHCNQQGVMPNMERYHFDNCEQASTLSEITLKRIEERNETKIRRKLKDQESNVGVKIVTCPHCGFEGQSGANIRRWHFDGCKMNPNQSEKSIRLREEMKERNSRLKKGSKWKEGNHSKTEEHKRKLSESHLNRPKIKCEHCNKEVNSINYLRWHGDNCKQSPNKL